MNVQTRSHAHQPWASASSGHWATFHGECNPPDALAARRNRRWRFIRPAGWVAEHWRE